MNLFARLKKTIPSPANLILVLFSAALLILAFPDFEFWFLAWFALVPMFFAVEREKVSKAKAFVLGWVWGTAFFFGTCWWLGYAPTHYGGIPAIISYFLAFCAAVIVGIFPAIFALLFSILLKRFGTLAILSAPFLWTAIEFLRFWTTGNNWNAIGYSQAFTGFKNHAAIGGIYLTGFFIVFSCAFISAILSLRFKENLEETNSPIEKFFRVKLKIQRKGYLLLIILFCYFTSSILQTLLKDYVYSFDSSADSSTSVVVAVQPNVPMSGLNYIERENLLERHVKLAEDELQKIKSQVPNPKSQIVIFPESPMNFMFERDKDFQAFLKDFATRNNASVLFNSAEPNAKDKNYFNSAVMVNERGEKIAQYDKIFLVPFGEYAPVPAPLQAFVPTMVGSFAAGNEYDLLDFGDAKAGVMICFESHFPNLSREFALRGADVLVEMTNDGYLGKTPVLRQHLASAVFRAVETHRPVLRVTNVGITAYINERGEVLDAADSYTEATRVWTVKKSDGAQTFYVKYGDWFAWLCSIVSLILLVLSFRERRSSAVNGGK